MPQGRKTGGRRKGTPNRATAEIREHAQQYTVEALEGLAQIARTSQSDARLVGGSPQRIIGNRAVLCMP